MEVCCYRLDPLFPRIPHPALQLAFAVSGSLRMSASVHANKMFDMQGRVALVTGGGTGIGWHIALGLAENGAKVYITGRRREVLEKAANAFAAEHKGNGVMIP